VASRQAVRWRAAFCYTSPRKRVFNNTRAIWRYGNGWLRHHRNTQNMNVAARSQPLYSIVSSSRTATWLQNGIPQYSYRSVNVLNNTLALLHTHHCMLGFNRHAGTSHVRAAYVSALFSAKIVPQGFSSTWHDTVSVAGGQVRSAAAGAHEVQCAASAYGMKQPEEGNSKYRQHLTACRHHAGTSSSGRRSHTELLTHRIECQHTPTRHDHRPYTSHQQRFASVAGTQRYITAYTGRALRSGVNQY